MADSPMIAQPIVPVRIPTKDAPLPYTANGYTTPMALATEAIATLIVV